MPRKGKGKGWGWDSKGWEKGWPWDMGGDGWGKGWDGKKGWEKGPGSSLVDSSLKFFGARREGQGERQV